MCNFLRVIKIEIVSYTFLNHSKKNKYIKTYQVVGF